VKWKPLLAKFDVRGRPERFAALVALALVALLLLAFNGLSWIALNRLLGRLESVVGERLVNTGLAISANLTPEEYLFLSLRDERDRIDLDVLRTNPSPSLNKLLDMLDRQSRASGLRSIALLTPEGRIVADPDLPARIGEMFPGIEKEAEERQKAAQGVAATTPLSQFQDNLTKCAYIPVFAGSPEVVALLRLEAGGDYFAGIILLRRALMFSIAFSTTLVLLGAWILRRLMRWTLDAERAMGQAERLGALGSLAAGLAHEIRNPLAIIRLSCEEMRAQLKAPANERAKAPESDNPEALPTSPSSAPSTAPGAEAELLDDIAEEVSRLEMLLEQFLALARPGTIKSDATLSRIADPAAVIRRISRLFEKGLRYGRVRLETRLPDAPLPPAALDEKSLGQALLNLLRNAAEAIPAEGGTITLSAETISDGSQVLITVSDTGRGMSEAVRRRAFEPFFSAREGGTGLGLAIVRQIAAGAGGTVEIESAPAQGTSVRLILPALRQPTGAVSNPQEQRSSSE